MTGISKIAQQWQVMSDVVARLQGILGVKGLNKETPVASEESKKTSPEQQLAWVDRAKNRRTCQGEKRLRSWTGLRV